MGQSRRGEKVTLKPSQVPLSWIIVGFSQSFLFLLVSSEVWRFLMLFYCSFCLIKINKWLFGLTSVSAK